MAVMSCVFNMTFDDDVLKIWRNAPGFNQRFTGVFNDDQTVLTCQWEGSPDGSA